MINDIKNDIFVVKYPEIENESLITEEFILEQIKEFTKISDKYERNNDYYLGKNKPFIQPNRDNPANRINIPYSKTMVSTVKGYMFKPGNIKYSSVKKTSKYFKEYMRILSLNNEELKNAEGGECQSKFGINFELCYLNENGDPVFYTINPKEIIPIFDNTIFKKLLGCIRFYKIDKNLKRVEVYTNDEVRIYDLEYDEHNTKNSLKLVETYLNKFRKVPLVIYKNNDECLADYESVQTLIDLLDQLMSDAANELNRFAAAYLILKDYVLGVDVETAKANIDKLKQIRIFEVGADGEVSFLTREIPTAFFEQIKQIIREEITYHSSIPDFRDKEFGTASGIAIRYKLLNFENLCADKEAWFKVGLLDRKSIIDNILFVRGFKPEDVEITFIRNIPVNVNEIAELINKFKSSDLPISERTLLNQIPFIQDIEKEIELYNKEKEEKMETIDLDDEEEIMEEDEE